MANEEMLKLIDQIDQSMECTLEGDPRSFQNPIHEFGWLFDCIARWRRQIRKIETTIENLEINKTEKRPKGKWTYHEDEKGRKSIDENTCSICGEQYDWIGREGKYFNYCPNCGADMVGGDVNKND